MTDTQLGRMFLVGFQGTAIHDRSWIVQMIQEFGPGGVILFARSVHGHVQNIDSPARLRTLTRDLHRSGGPGLLVAVDQEGGAVCRLRQEDGFRGFADARSLAAAGPAVLADQARAMAAELADHGIDWNLAPVVDLDLEPDNPIIGRYGRSFGSNPAEVSQAARAFILAHHEFHIPCCLKHFPGHGSSKTDSHQGFVDCSQSWQAKELIPYDHLIRAGLADAVMVAHVVNRQLDPSGTPASLSAPIIQGVLRTKLGFNGLVVCDDLQMGAITKLCS